MERKRAVFTYYEDKAGKWRWRLTAANGEQIDASEGYASESNAKRGAKTLTEAVIEAGTPDEPAPDAEAPGANP